MRFNFHTVKKRRVMIFLFFLTFLNLINAQGPNSPEASGFEPVDATDMVNLTNGNLSYVLPLLEVDGFPVTLSYHAGMTMDMDASWTGLGWYLNPGAINRSVTNTPDDWKSGVGMNFNSFYDEVDYYGITVDVGLGEGASIGAGLNWGGGQGMAGSVSASMLSSRATRFPLEFNMSRCHFFALKPHGRLVFAGSKLKTKKRLVRAFRIPSLFRPFKMSPMPTLTRFYGVKLSATS